jgi:hypothetical protein
MTWLSYHLREVWENLLSLFFPPTHNPKTDCSLLLPGRVFSSLFSHSPQHHSSMLSYFCQKCPNNCPKLRYFLAEESLNSVQCPKSKVPFHLQSTKFLSTIYGLPTVLFILCIHTIKISIAFISHNPYILKVLYSFIVLCWWLTSWFGCIHNGITDKQAGISWECRLPSLV